MQDINIIRHSLAHILAIAVKDIFPIIRLGMGPAIENGFYYDFETVGDKQITEADLEIIENRMKEIISSGRYFEKISMSRQEAEEIFTKEPYKLELLAELPDNDITVYKTGEFYDLCKGPHIESTTELTSIAFKLSKIAGAYWRGDEKNKMLVRIYGLAFSTAQELEDYLKMITEAEKRDHRKLGREFDLFHIDDIVGSGLVLWHPKGARLWRIIEDFWFDKHLENGYDLVRTPHIGNSKLWKKSGHWGFYSNSMYPPLEVGQSLEDLELEHQVVDSEQYLLKPMNCPFHVAIYNNSIRSYRDLPFRWAETGTVYRFEKKGELSGLTRVRGFTQDDAHIICRKDQVEEELKKVIDFILFIYQSFGFGIETVNVYLSLRDPSNKDKYAGSDEGWNFSESVLRKVAQEKGLNFKEEEGEAAFYGPKLDFKIKDALGREWQCSTLQFDFNLPERFEMSFVNDKGEKEQPYMLHRALFGSFERFIGLLIEHYAGAFPFWLSPVQIKVVPVSDNFMDYAKKIANDLKMFRVEIDSDNQTIGKKIREAEMEKVPYILVVGAKEQGNNTVSVRKRGQQDLGEMSLGLFINDEILKQ